MRANFVPLNQNRLFAQWIVLSVISNIPLISLRCWRLLPLFLRRRRSRGWPISHLSSAEPATSHPLSSSALPRASTAAAFPRQKRKLWKIRDPQPPRSEKICSAAAEQIIQSQTFEKCQFCRKMNQITFQRLHSTSEAVLSSSRPICSSFFPASFSLFSLVSSFAVHFLARLTVASKCNQFADSEKNWEKSCKLKKNSAEFRRKLRDYRIEIFGVWSFGPMGFRVQNWKNYFLAFLCVVDGFFRLFFVEECAEADLFPIYHRLSLPLPRPFVPEHSRVLRLPLRSLNRNTNLKKQRSPDPSTKFASSPNFDCMPLWRSGWKYVF